MQTVHCAFPECNIVESIPKSAPIYGDKWYCRGHQWARSKTNPEIQHPGPDAKIIVQLTKDQIAEICETMGKHYNDPPGGLRPIPVAQIEADQFWKEVLTDVAAEQGLSMAEAIRRELHDYKFIMDNMPQILEHATGGKLSKLMYPADVVCAEIDDHINSVVAAAVKEVTADNEPRADIIPDSNAPPSDREIGDLTLRRDSGADLEIKISPLEIERDKYRKALQEIRVEAAVQTGPVGRIIEKVSRLAREALGDS